MLTTKQAISKIKKVYNKEFEKFEEIIEFFVDEETETTYTWRFKLPSRGIEIICDKTTGKVTVID